MQKGNPILCQKCGQGGGTLVKLGEGYAHNKCPARRISIKPKPVEPQKGTEIPVDPGQSL